MMPIYRSLITNNSEIDHLRSGKFVECFSYIHDDFFSDLETAMANVAEAMMTFEEACKWLSAWCAGNVFTHSC